MRTGFLDQERLIKGPWQMFERDCARLMIANGFDDVRIVAGTGDHGGDVLGLQNGQLWVFQCKFTSSSSPSRDAITEVVEAAKFYGASRMVVAVSRQPSEAFWSEVQRLHSIGLKVEIIGPRELLNLVESSPEYPPRRPDLRDYQQDAAVKMRNSLVERGRGQIVLATGLGKTVVMADVTAALLREELVEGGRVLVLAHTRDLVEQLHRSFWYHLPKWIPTHQLTDGETPPYWDGIVFATVQSVLSRLRSLPLFGLVLVDEAHHIGSDTYQRVLKALNAPLLAGVTATPWRGDAYDIDQVFGPPVFTMGIADGLARGFLVNVDYRLLADNINWQVVQEASSFKYSLAQLNKQLILPIRDEEAARRIRAVFDGDHRHSGIVFCPTIVHAESFAAGLRKFGLRSEIVSSESPARERDKLLSRFRAGDLDCVTTVDLFNEGVDVPDVDLIVFMRTTHSRRIFVQQLGRGLRIGKDKDKVIVLDFVTDLRRIAEVVQLDRAVRRDSVERLSLGGNLIAFSDRSAGSFLYEWMLDQADLMTRQGDSTLNLPQFNFPEPRAPGGLQ